MTRSFLVPFILGCNLMAQGLPQAPDLRVPRAPMGGGAKQFVPATSKPPTPAIPADPVLTPANSAPRALAVGDAEPARTLATAGDVVLFDQPRPGEPLWVSAPGWKASFAAAEWSFVPFLGSAAPRNFPVGFSMPQVRLAGEALPMAATAPTRKAQRIEYDHGGCVQAFDVDTKGLEQTFRFDRLPTRGEIVLTMATHSELTGADRGVGLDFRNELGGVSYGEAVAFDARGMSVPAETTFADGVITIRVPAAFVAAASLPLTIDPLVQSQPVVNGTAIVANSDVAWVETGAGASVAICYQRVFSALDTDCLVVQADADMVVQGQLVIDATGVSWTSPKIASNNASDSFLVVCQVSLNQAAPYWIGGRTFSPAVVGVQIDIERAGVAGHFTGNAFRPDVGGDSAPSGPSYFTVVWEREYGPADHDIAMKQVTPAGALRSASATTINNSLAYQSNPTISKSSGGAHSSLQRWAVVYQQTFGPGDEDLYGAVVTWDGQLVSVGGNTIRDIDRSAANTTSPRVSSVSAVPDRTFLIASEVPLALGSIRLQVTDADLGWIWTNDIVTLENDALRGGWAKRSPCVDCDGVRFTVAYQEAYQSTTDWDVRGSLIAFDRTRFLFTQEVGTGFSASGQIDLFPEIASRYSGSGLLSERCAITCQSSSGGTFQIIGAAYSARAPVGGASLRATACGPLTVGWAGVPVLGQRMDFTLYNAQGLTGYLFGLPANVTIPACPGCIVGVDGASILGGTLAIVVPTAPSFVGVTVSLQGFAFGGGPCLGQITLSDTVDLRIL